MRAVILTFVGMVVTLGSRGQSIEAQQLILNWEKLAQLKGILENMYKGYEVLNDGYTKIKHLSEGNYSLHQVFLDRMLEVNPVVRNYKKVADLLAFQKSIIREQKEARLYFRKSQRFSPEELQYLDRVYEKLLRESLKNVEELTLVITKGQLRMSDEERLRAIDRIDADMREQIHFLHAFNASTKVLSEQRKSEAASIAFSRKGHGVK